MFMKLLYQSNTNITIIEIMLVTRLFIIVPNVLYIYVKKIDT